MTICPTCGAQSSEPIPLTRRERDVIPLIAKNLSDKEIANALFICEQTARNTIHRLRKKLNATSRMDIVVRAGTESTPH